MSFQQGLYVQPAKSQAFCSYTVEVEIPVILEAIVLQCWLTLGIIKRIWQIFGTESSVFTRVIAMAQLDTIKSI